MKKIYELDQKLEKLQSQKKSFNSFENTSVIQFIRYKKILSKENKIINKLHKLNLLAKEVNFLYDINTKSWIANPEINCRKYYKMEQNASYKKDLTLYKLGILKRKPTSPFLQNVKNHLPKPNYSKYNFIKKINKQLNNFISNILPQKINKLAVSIAKIGITGYRKLQNSYKFIQNSFTNKNSVKYVKGVIDEANRQISISEKRNTFVQSLKFPTEDIKSQKPITNSCNGLTKSKITKKDNFHKSYEYSL